MNKLKLSLILVATILAQGAFAQCSDLFFSEYIEGSSSNKSLEIYNPTSTVVDLSDYVVYRANNGSFTPTDSIFMQGMLGADSVFVITNPSANAAIASESDTTHTLCFYNGDDAVYMIKISTGDTLDIIGVVGVDPGSGWTVGTGATNNNTLVRKASTFSGQLDWSIGVTEWDVFPIDMTDSLGAHTKLSCPSVAVDLVITEIMYNPAAVTDSMEFIEIFNNGSSAVDLTGYNFSQGVVYTFPSVTLAPDSFIIVARDSVAMNGVYGVFAYQWTSGSLSNTAEDIVLQDNFGVTIDSVDYDDGSPWPVGPPSPDGGGPSIELTDVNLDNNLASSWTVSTTVVVGVIENGLQVYATPGAFPSAAARLLAIVDSVVTCNGGSDGSISLSVVNGTAPFSYSWSNSDTTASLINIGAGTYSVTVTDGVMNNLTGTYVITEPSAISIVVNIDSNVSCNGLANGGLTATATGGTGNLNYTWSTANSALAAQSFESTMMDNWIFTASPVTYNTEGDSIVNGSDDVWAVIEEFTGDIDTASNGLYFWGMQDIDNTNGGGSFYHTLTFDPIDVSTETGVFFAFDYYSIGFDSTDSIEYQVKFDNGTTWDNNGTPLNKVSQAWTTVEIAVPDTASFVRVRLQAKQNGSTDYAGFDNVRLFKSPNVINGLMAGTYTVTVTDSLGCSSTGTATITEPAVLSASVVLDSNTSMIGASDGGATVSGFGGTTPYTYLWSNTATTASITGVMAGNYAVTVTDANGCSDTASVNITQPIAILLSGIVTNTSCNGGNDGAIDLSLTNGTMPFNYLWSNGDTIQDIDTLTAGTYSVTVTDANMITASATYTVNQPAAIVVNVTVDSNATCNGLMNGGLTATATGGTGNLSYQWSAGNRSLAAQSFESTMNDTWNFVMNPGTYNTEGDSIVAGSDDVWAVIQEFTGNISAASNGSLFWGIQDIENGNGGGAFYHTLSFDPINVSTETGVKLAFDYYSIGFDGSDSIEYQVQFDNGTNWDSNGVILNKNSQAWTTITVDVPDTASFVRVRLQAKQNGSSDYAGFDNVRLFTGSSSITGVGAGNYVVTVTDSLGCTSTATATVTEPAVLTTNFVVVDATTVGGTDGSIAATTMGGTPNYTYAWSNNATGATNSNLSAGNYSVTITDANGCSIIDSAVVSDPAAILLVMDSSNVSCFGAADGTAKVIATGGSGTYSYMWSNMATTDSIGGLVAGTYVVTVSDLVGTVTAVDSVVISEPLALQLSLSVTNASSVGVSDGAINLAVNGGTPGFTYNWSNSATTRDLTLLAAGTYSVTVTDTNGCQIVDSATVLEPGILAQLVITEINYNGPESGLDTSEFIEFTNAGSIAISLNNYTFVQGVSHTFGVTDTIAAGQYFVLAYDSSAFRNTYGIDADAVWNSGGLSNGGEDITLVDNFGRTIDSVDFENSAPWPVNTGMVGPVGNGSSIELQTALTSDNNLGSNWVASALAVSGSIVNGFQVYGSPGNPITTGINVVASEENSVKVFPNPTRGIITIETTSGVAERIQLISMEGKLIRDLQTANNQTQLDMSELANGVYFLKVGSETHKVILSR